MSDQGFVVAVSGWTGGTLLVTPDGEAGETYDLDTELAVDVSDVRTVAQSIVDWGNDAGRGWSGSVTFSFTLTDDLPQHKVQLATSTSNTDWVSAGGLKTNMDFPASETGSTTVESDDGLPSTLNAKMATHDDHPHVFGAGVTAGAGSWLSDSQAVSQRRPDVFALLDEAEMLAMNMALETASSPRSFIVYSHGRAGWFGPAQLGSVTVDVVNFTHYRATFEVTA